MKEEREINEKLKAMEHLLREKLDNDLKSRWDSMLKNEHIPKDTPKTIRLVPWLRRIAAAAVLLTGVFWLIQSSTQNLEQMIDDQLASTVVMSPGETSSRGDAVLESEEYVKVGELFEQGKYQELVSLMQDQTINTPQSSDLTIYYGIALCRLDQPRFNEAISVFNEYIHSGGEMSIEAMWFAALAHLSLGEYVQGKDLLKLVKQASYKVHDIDELLKKIEN